MLRRPALSRVVAEDGPSSPMVRRYGFPEAESDPLRSPSPSTSEQRSPSLVATFDGEDLHVDPPVEWVREEQQPRIRVRPTCEAGVEMLKYCVRVRDRVRTEHMNRCIEKFQAPGCYS